MEDLSELRYVSLCGLLGYGYPPESLARALRKLPAFLGVDAGSTDPGPYYLGSGTSFVKPVQVTRDLAPALRAAREHGVPLIIGTAGGSGAQPHVETFLELLKAVAQREGLHFRLAVIHADIEPGLLQEALQAGRVQPCSGSGPLTPAQIDSCVRLVGQMGTAPLITALQSGAEVIVAGRCCDTAIFAALPLMKGFDAGLAFHAAKIAECGTLCAFPGGANDALVCTLHDDCFVVEPANPGKRCTRETVAAHSLYEQPDPNCFIEPEGRVDMSDCVFKPQGERAVRVSGSRLVPSESFTIKVEGAALSGYRAICVAGIQDPTCIDRLAEIEESVRAAVQQGLDGALEPSEYSLLFHKYGTGSPAMQPDPCAARRGAAAAVVIEAIAPTQDLADTAVSLARSTALHQSFTGRKTTAGNLAFPFSPSDFQGGPVYTFAVYHLVTVDDPASFFPVAFEDI